MIKSEKVYNIKVYGNELSIIIAVLLDKIQELRIQIENEQSSIQKSCIQSNINKYMTIITRLNTGALYNDYIKKSKNN